nr:hypothetical protein [Pacificibacter marinus]
MVSSSSVDDDRRLDDPQWDLACIDRLMDIDTLEDLIRLQQMKSRTL